MAFGMLLEPFLLLTAVMCLVTRVVLAVFLYGECTLTELGGDRLEPEDLLVQIS